MSHRGHHASTAGTSTHAGEDWRREAACRDMDTELFFPVGEPGTTGYERAAAVARQFCHEHCDVIAECLDDAVRVGDRYGIRGGLDPDERAAQFGRRTGRKPAYPCAVCGVGMGRPKRTDGFQQRYCSDECRGEAKRQQRAAQRRRKREVAA